MALGFNRLGARWSVVKVQTTNGCCNCLFNLWSCVFQQCNSTSACENCCNYNCNHCYNGCSCCDCYCCYCCKPSYNYNCNYNYNYCDNNTNTNDGGETKVCNYNYARNVIVELRKDGQKELIICGNDKGMHVLDAERHCNHDYSSICDKNRCQKFVIKQCWYKVTHDKNGACSCANGCNCDGDMNTIGKKSLVIETDNQLGYNIFELQVSNSDNNGALLIDVQMWEKFINGFSFDLNDIFHDTWFTWQIHRVIWIGYMKNDKNQLCILPKVPKDIITKILSYLTPNEKNIST